MIIRIMNHSHSLLLSRGGFTAKRAHADEPCYAAFFVVPDKRLPLPELGRVAAAGREMIPRLRAPDDIVQGMDTD